jgi:hypothetical protein
MAHLFVAGIEQEVARLAERAVAPGLQVLVQQLGRPAHLRGGQALDAELGHDGFDVPGGDALDVHLGHGAHHGADRAPPALRGLRVEWRVAMPGRLGDQHGRAAGGRVDPLGLVAVGVALALGRALVAPRAGTARARAPSPARRRGRRRPRCRSGLARSAVPRGPRPPSPSARPCSVSHGCVATPWNTRMGSHRRGMPRRWLSATEQNRISRPHGTVPAPRVGRW